MPSDQEDLNKLVEAARALNSAYTAVFLVNPEESDAEAWRVAWPETCAACGHWFDFPANAVAGVIPLGLESCCADSFPKAGLMIKPEREDLIAMLRSHLAQHTDTSTATRALPVAAEPDEVCDADAEDAAPQVEFRTRGAGAAEIAGELSGPQWVARFPTSHSIFDLKPPFQARMAAFFNALTAAGATIKISATVRPAERAYLMHWSFKIANKGQDPQTVPPMAGVNINWWHGDPNSSRDAARQMVSGYGIVHAPALNSLHTQGLAIDMTIGWTGTLSIKDAQGQVRAIGAPNNGSNPALHQVGKTYGVIKLVSDPPHWSVNGH